MNHTVDSFIPIALFAMIFLIVFFTAKFQHMTKKAILDKGGSIEVIKKKFPFLEIGLTILGLGLGLGFSVIPQSSDLPEGSKRLLIGAFILLFGGLGLISAYFIRRKIEKEK